MTRALHLCASGSFQRTVAAVAGLPLGNLARNRERELNQEKCGLDMAAGFTKIIKKLFSGTHRLPLPITIPISSLQIEPSGKFPW